MFFCNGKLYLYNSAMQNTECNLDFDYVCNRPLAPDGCDGDGSLCGFHCLCSSAEFEGVNTTSLRALTLRRILGLFLSVCV